MSGRSVAFASVVLVIALGSVSCFSNAGDAATQPRSGTTDGMDHSDGMSSIGAPGSAGEVDRTVTITQLDTPSFDPPSVTATAGETIRFEITNAGADVHEFVLGDEAMQTEHGSEMDDMEGAMASGDENAVSVEPGATETLIWMFDEAGTVLYGCHVNGHYEAGMVGTIDIEG